MNKDLRDFIKHIEINEDMCKYQDEKGNVLYTKKEALFSNCSYIELTKDKYEQAKFQGTVKEDNYNIIEIDQPISKYEITKKEEDKFILTNKKVKVRQVWIVSNSLGFMTSFKNKEEALKLVEDIERLLL